MPRAAGGDGRVAAIETELKFQVPRGQRGALRAAVATASARTTRLQAVYADTAGSHLAAASLALRLRKEGRVWVQTLKGRGDGVASRFEHEVVLPRVQGMPGLPGLPGPPTLDASLHDGTALAPVLQRALGTGGALLPVYRTDIQRLHRRLRFQGAVIELALDRGHLLAGDQHSLVSLAVHEIEFELISGPAVALPALAAQWAARFGLWWDVRTKSERGFRLAHGLQTVPAIKPAAVVAAGQPPLQALLAQVLPNAAELAGGSGTAAHLAALRQGLQALKAAVARAEPGLADETQRLLLDLHDFDAAPALLRAAPFTALMLALLSRALAAQPARPR